MRNLIFNAVKFTPVRGEITIAAKKIPGGFVEISVSDTGIGMEKSMIDKIFRLDEQTHRKGTEGEPSTGLGLILCKEFAEKHGGRIWAESEENNGSTFYFTIPLKADMEEKSINNTYVATEEAANQVKNLTILIVEDDEISEMLIQMAFKTYASKVISVHTGLEAVETCRNNPDLDLVMMDIQTPDIDGYEATRLIRKFNKEIVIIAQTAFASAEDYTNAINAGCNDYISKPISIKALKRLIEKHFNPPQTEIGEAK
jgi:CheY-like chemotaxis protein